MKKILVIIMTVVSGVCYGQSQEAQQLLLDWEKLTQFKKILQDMKDGYQIVHKGYTTIRDISSGSFNLHKDFLDALEQISPAVKKYNKIADIINYQLAMVITAGKLRMSDDERLAAIDKIYTSIEDQFSFLQDFNSSTSYLSLQRKGEQAEIEMSKRIHGY